MNQGNLKDIQLAFLNRQANAKPVVVTSAAKPATSSSTTDFPTTTTKRTKKGRQSATKQLIDVVNFLRSNSGKPYTPDEIKLRVQIEIIPNTELFKLLVNNQFIVYVDGKFSYKSMFSMRNGDEFLEQLNKTPDGIEWDNLKDIYSGIEQDLETLIQNKKAFRILNAETKTEVIYPNDTRFSMNVAWEFRELWDQVKIPDVVDLQKRMQQAGLTVSEQEKKTNKRPGPKQKKQRARKIKLTNVHLDSSQIDLTTDVQL